MAGMGESRAGSMTEAKKPSASKPWLELIDDAEKCFSFWQEKCDSIDKLYADLKAMAADSTEREFQIFWANLEVLKPSIYSRPPVPVVVPRYKNFKELPRIASQVLERSLVTSFDIEDINDTMTLIRDDLAICSRGVMWLRYEAAGYEGKLNEKSCYDHLDRKDFLHDPARKWKEVEWVARRSWLTSKKGVERFGDAFLGADFKERSTDKDGEYKGEKKAAVWEIWHKTDNTVVWVTEGVEDVLDQQDPFLDLEGFFPCPRPAYGTLQRGSLIPVPDFLYYKDQVEEINELTARISALAEALRLKGFYASGGEDVGEAIETALKQQDNSAILIPVPNVGAMGAGMKDAIVWLPVKEVAEVIVQLIALRKELISDVYEITGLSDIMRGATDANETLGAQELKSQYGSIRIRDRQAALIRIARDAARMSGEIMAENFQAETLLSMSQMEIATEQRIAEQVQQIMQQAQQAAASPQGQQMLQQQPEQAQQLIQQAEGQIQKLQQTVTIEKVVEMLRSQKVRPFVLDIETDSTIQPDEDANKQRTTEFLTALGGAISQLSPMVQSQPQSAGFAGEVLKFAVGPFRAGRDLEASIDDFVEQMKQVASQPKEDPEAKKIEAEAAAKQQEAADKAKEREADMAMEREKHGMAMEKLRAELAALEKKLAIEERRATIKAAAEQQSAALKLDAQERSTELTLDGQERANELKARQAKQKEPA